LAGYVARVEEKCVEILVGKSERKTSLEKIILKWIFDKYGLGMWTGLIW